MRGLITVAAVGAALAFAGTARAASALCVGGPHCFATIQAALDAARDGDTIRVAPGTYTGGIVVLKSVDIVGGGAAATRISGGGPVVTIGSPSAAPAVSLTGLTVTGGLATSDPQAPRCGPDVPRCGPGYADATALGGGIEAFPGTTVTIRSSAVTGNRAVPVTTVPSVRAVCPGSIPCPASFGDAAGIDNWGTMTLVSTAVSDNHAFAVQSNGGGIVNEVGASLTILNSRVVGNSASAAAPFGRFASGGGIFADHESSLTIENSSIDGNAATLANSLPHPYPLQGGSDAESVSGGGILLADGARASISNSTLNGNAIAVETPLGEGVGADAALCACGDAPVTIENSRIAGNVVRDDVLTTADVGAMGGILEADGDVVVRNTHVTGNSVLVDAPTGDAGAFGAVTFLFGTNTRTIENSSIDDNVATANAPTGAASVQGAGLVNDGPLVLRNAQIDRNSGRAIGASGAAQGGGIWNGVVFDGPPSPLTLENTRVDANSVGGSAGVAAAGGGIFTQFPLTLLNSRIAHNLPDDCAGC